VFVAWRYGPSDPRPLLLELQNTGKGTAVEDMLCVHATHGPWNGQLLSIITGQGHSEPLWWTGEGGALLATLSPEGAGMWAQAAHDLHTTVLSALYHLLAPVRLHVQSGRPQATGRVKASTRTWRDELALLHPTLGLDLGLVFDEHAHEAGAAHPHEVTFVVISEDYDVHAEPHAFGQVPYVVHAGGTAAHRTRAICFGKAILWAYWPGSPDLERCLVTNSTIAAQVGCSTR